jgi:hypothetical protein
MTDPIWPSMGLSIYVCIKYISYIIYNFCSITLPQAGRAISCKLLIYIPTYKPVYVYIYYIPHIQFIIACRWCCRSCMAQRGPVWPILGPSKRYTYYRLIYI